MTYRRTKVARLGQWLERAAHPVTPARVEGVAPPSQLGAGVGDAEELHDPRYGRTDGQTDRKDI